MSMQNNSSQQPIHSTSQNVVPGPSQNNKPSNLKAYCYENVPDVKWNHENQAARYTQFYSGPWLTSSPVGTSTAFVAPAGVFGSTLQANPFNQFCYARYTASIRVDVSSSKFYAGKLLVGWQPYTGATTPQMTDLLNGPHALIDACGSSSTIVDYPFVYPTDSISCDANIGTFWVFVFSQLVSGTATSVSITLSSAFKEACFTTPRLVPATYSLSTAPYLPPPVPPDPTPSEMDFVITPHGNSIQKITKISVGGNLTAPVEMQGDAFDAKNEVDPTMSTAVGVGPGSAPSAALLSPRVMGPVTPKIVSEGSGPYITEAGEDQPMPSRSGMVTTGAMDLIASTLDPVLMWPSPRPNLNSVANVEPVHEMRMYPGAETQCEPKHFSTDIDEMRVDYLIRKPAILQRFVISTTTSPGTLLFYTPITPSAQLLLNTVSYGVTPEPMPLLPYLASLCEFWTGDLEFTFVFSSNFCTTGKIRIVAILDPSYTTYATAIPISETSNQYYLDYDLSDQAGQVTVRVPFVSRYRACPTAKGPYYSDSGDSQSVYGKPFIGALHVYMMNDFSTENSIPTLDVDVFLAGGPTFQLSAPTFVVGAWDDVFNAYWSGMAAAIAAVPAGKKTRFANANNTGLANINKDAVAQAVINNLNGGLAPAKLTPHGEVKTCDVVKASACLYDTDMWTTNAVNIVGHQRYYPIGDLAGERFCSIRDLFKRRWFIPAWNCLMGDYDQIYPTASFIANCPFLPLLTAFNLMRGSLRITFELDKGQESDQSPNGTCIQIIVHPSLYSIGTTPWSTNVKELTGPYVQSGIPPYPACQALTAVISDSNPCCTIEIPFMWNSPTYATKQLGSAALADSDSPWGYISTVSTNSGAYVHAYCGFADDMRLGNLYRQPRVILQPLLSSAPWWDNS